MTLMRHSDTVRYSFALHGCLLSLAELVRRNVINFDSALTPSWWPDLCNQHGSIDTKCQPLLLSICKLAIHCLYFFLPSTSAMSICQPVRDTAAFLIWSISRSVPRHLLCVPLPSLTLIDWLISHLMCSALTDDDINCRKSSSSALQELIGRNQADSILGAFCLLDRIHFFSIASARRCFEEIIPQLLWSVIVPVLGDNLRLRISFFGWALSFFGTDFFFSR